MDETEPHKPKPRPILRIVFLLISHCLIVSIVCYTAGVLALLLLPVLAKNTYISENALMPGSASSMVSGEDVSEANKFIEEITSLNLKPESSDIHRLIAQHMVDVAGKVSYHKFCPQLNKFHPFQFFSSPDAGMIQKNCSCSSYGANVVGIIRAPRGDGKEAIVLVTPYNSVKTTRGEALSLGIAYSVFSLLSRVTWLAKDVIWLAADSQHGEYTPVAAWLRDYHTPLFGGLGKVNDKICDGNITLYESKISPSRGAEISYSFCHAGTVAAALVIKVVYSSEKSEKNALSIFAEASNGQMPNLDLINIVNYLAVHGKDFHVKVEKMWSLLYSKWLKSLGELFESIGKVAKSWNPKWMFGISVAEYVEGTATLASSLYNQALGIPTGPHGAFREYQVDAITLEMSPKDYNTRQNEFLLQGGRLVEGVVRSVNNLLEKFHQSFFLYLLISPTKFVSVGVYMIAFVLLVTPLPVVAAALYSDANKFDSCSRKDKVTSSPASVTERPFNFRSWKWLHAAERVLVFHLFGAAVTVLPYFLYQIPDCSSATRLLIWVLLSVSSLLILYLILGSSFSLVIVSQPKGKNWALLKSVAVSAYFIGLCLMSIINFAVAELGALLMVPLCLTATPIRPDVEVQTFRRLARAAFNLVLIFIAFPPTAFFLLKGAFEGFGGINIGDFWNWAESLWVWNSATYIYICMVHLPCWALCFDILFHRS